MPAVNGMVGSVAALGAVVNSTGGEQKGMIDELIAKLMPGLDLLSLNKEKVILYVAVLMVASYLSINLLRLVVKIVRGD